MPRPRRRRRWKLAKDVLYQALESMGVEDPATAFGRLRYLGDGMSYTAYTTTCLLPGRETRRDVVVRVPRDDADDDLGARGLREVAILDYLRTLEPEIQLPYPIAIIELEDDGIALVQEMIYGVPLETRAARNPLDDPWDVVAEAAAFCHGVDIGPLEDVVPGFPTRREHALDRLDNLADVEHLPEGREARDWAQQHLPEPRPCRLVHGDLLGQNLKVGLDEETPLGILDWEFAVLGDPAYELSVVTGGVRRPFGVQRGLERLIDAYNARTGEELTPAHVQLYEIAMLAGYYGEDADEWGSNNPHTLNTLRQFRAVVRRALVG